MVQYKTEWYSTIQYRMVQSGTIQNGAVQLSTILYNTLKSMRNITIQYSTVPLQPRQKKIV